MMNKFRSLQHRLLLLFLGVGVGVYAELTKTALSSHEELVRLQELDSRIAPNVVVEYGDNHPFERHHRAKAEGRKLEENIYDGFEPIRINFFTEHLDDYAVENPDKAEQVEFAKDNVLWAAAEYWRNALSVYPAERVPVVQSSEWCQAIGVTEGSDLVLTVIADQGCSASTLAYASVCQYDQHDRPVAGIVGLCFSTLSLSVESGRERALSILVHELAHVLGLASSEYAYFRDISTGEPRTPQPVNKVKTQCVNGDNRKVTLPSSNTLFESENGRGVKHFEIVTPTVQAVVRNQFNCPTMMGARLESQPTAPNDCFGSHWEHRLYHNEMMSAIFMKQSRYLTPITLAALEDTGWYKANYSTASIMPFGHGAGCGFVEGDCIVDGRVPSYAEGFFCSTESMTGCNMDQTQWSICDVIQHDTELPEEFQYFDEATMGGGVQQLDYCPVFRYGYKYINNVRLSAVDCTDPANNPFVSDFEKFGDGARCLESNLEIMSNVQIPLCLDARCNEQEHAVEIFFGDSSHLCEFDGQEVDIPGSDGVTVKCPRIAVFCPDLICPANCAGRGVCDYSLDDPICICNDPDDTDPRCINSEPGYDVSVLERSSSPSFDSSDLPSSSPSMIPMSELPQITSMRPSAAPSNRPSPSPIVTIDGPSPSTTENSSIQTTPPSQIRIIPTSPVSERALTLKPVGNQGDAIPAYSSGSYRQFLMLTISATLVAFIFSL